MSIRINVGATFDARDIKAARRELDALEDQARQLSGTMGKVVRTFENVGGAMVRAGAVLTKAVTVPLIGAGVTAVKTAADFQMSMSKIVGLVGIASDEVRAMEGAVLALSRETARGPQELADALFVVTSAGLRGSDATDALSASARAAAAGLGQTADIARSVAGVMNAYGDRVGSAAQVTDVLVATARAGNFETSQLAGALGRVLPFATQAQVSIEDLGGAVALLTRTNGNAAESITQVQSLFRAFVVPTEEAKKILDAAGLSAQNLRNQMGQQGLVETLRTLDRALGGNREQLGRLLGSTEAASAAFQILDASSDTLAGTFGVTNDAVGMTDSAFQNAADQSAFKFAQALNDLKVIAIDLGNELLPVVTGIVEKIRDLTAGFMELTPEQRESVLQFGFWAAAIPIAITAIGGFIVIVAAATAALAAMSTAMIIATGGLVLLGAAVAGIAYQQMTHDSSNATRALELEAAAASNAAAGYDEIAEAQLRIARQLRADDREIERFGRQAAGVRDSRAQRLAAEEAAAAETALAAALTDVSVATDDVATSMGGAGSVAVALTSDMRGLLQQLNETQVGSGESGDAIAQFARELLAAGKITSETSGAAERLAKTIRQNLDKALADGNRRLEEARKKFEGYRDVIAGGIRSGNTLSDAVSGQTAALEELTRAEADYKDAVKSKDSERIKEALDALNAARRRQTSFLSFLQTGADSAQGFASQIDALRAAGASMEVVQQIAQLGATTGGRVISELMAGGAEAIQQANRLVSAVEDASIRAGTAAAKQFHGAGIRSAKQFIEAIEATIPELQIVLDRIADMIEAALGTRPNVKIDGSAPTSGSSGTVVVDGSGGGGGGGPRPEPAGDNRLLVPGTFLAAGGLVTGPTFGVVGEAGPELVIPLNRLGGMGGDTYVINVSGALDAEGVARQIERVLRDSRRRTGGVLV